jgi:hypothetical protein
VSGWHDIFEVQNPEDVVVVTRYQLTTGQRLGESGLTPYVGLTLVGASMSADGRADFDTRSEKHNVFDADAAEELARDLLQAAQHAREPR